MTQPTRTPAPVTWDFFLCHASPDKPLIERIYTLLTPHGRVFLDSQCIGLGQDWSTVINQALLGARIICLFISAHTDAAFFARAEILKAIALYRAYPERYRLVPIHLQGFPAPDDMRMLELGPLQAISGLGETPAAIARKLVVLHSQLTQAP